jgi:hypothetical protein
MLAVTLKLKRGINELILIMAYFLCEIAIFLIYKHYFKTITREFSYIIMI